jgi:nucleotide-binding universal stress UspA family protein
MGIKGRRRHSSMLDASICPERLMFKHILVPTDGSRLSAHAVKAAAGLARASGGKVTLFHVIAEYKTPYYPDGYIYDFGTKSEYEKETGATAAKLIGKARDLVGKKVRVIGLHGYSDRPATAILAAAKRQKADVIVMASHGRRGVEKLLLGSETQKVVTLSKIPVLVVK